MVDQDGPSDVLPPADVQRARALTGQLRSAIAEVEQAGAVLAERVRQAHQARVWLALGYRSWGDYAHGELGVSRAQAYRLVEIAGTAQQLVEVAGALGLSPAGDPDLSGRALRDLRGRMDEFATELAERVQAAGIAEAADVTAMIRDVVTTIRSRPPAAVTAGTAGEDRPEVAQARAALAQYRANAAELGTLMVEIAPGYQAEADVTDVLGMFAEDIGISLNEALAYRRYALTGDNRCLDIAI